MLTVRNWLPRLLALSLAGAVGLCALVVVVGLWLSAPAGAVVGLPPPLLPGFQEIQIASESGAKLSGWWSNTANPRTGVVVLMHGVHGNRSFMVRRAKFLHEHGYGALLFDLQAHGESTGKRITFGRLEALDAASAVAFVHEQAPGERVGVIGVSLGGAAAVLGTQPLAVEALVLESVYSDIDAALSNRLRAHLGPPGFLITPLLTRMFEILLPPILGVCPSELRPLDAIGSVTAPVLIASGVQDELTTMDEAKALFARAHAPKQFWPVPGAGHVDLERFDPDAYWQNVLPFLTEHLQQDSVPARP